MSLRSASFPLGSGRSRHALIGRKGPLAALSVLVMLAVLALGALGAVAAPGPHAGGAAAKKKAPAAKVTIAKVTAKGPKVTVSGKVTLPSSLKNTAKNRKRVKVSLTLRNSAGKSEAFTAPVGKKLTFAVTRTTRLTGLLSAIAQAKIDGKKSGRAAAKDDFATVTIKTTGAGTVPATTAPTTTTPGATAPTSPAGSTPLVGLFRIEAGQQATSGKLSGTWFKMLGGPEGVAFVNTDSPLIDPTYTPLSPGTDGGLRTDIYQPAPSPPFTGATSGDALANRIVQPQTFFSVKFSIVTAPTDPQSGEPDPLPEIRYQNGSISGQITPWAAQWNGQSFNQGSPKPNGSYAPLAGNAPAWGKSGTVPLRGTYNPETRRFVLEWQSLIIGGPFNNFTGQWHLEGVFEPAQ